jgi:hypothetical protein
MSGPLKFTAARGGVRRMARSLTPRLTSTYVT